MNPDREMICSFTCPGTPREILMLLGHFGAQMIGKPAAEALAIVIAASRSVQAHYDSCSIEANGFDSPTGRRCTIKIWESQREGPS